MPGGTTGGFSPLWKRSDQRRMTARRLPALASGMQPDAFDSGALRRVPKAPVRAHGQYGLAWTDRPSSARVRREVTVDCRPYLSSSELVRPDDPPLLEQVKVALGGL